MDNYEDRPLDVLLRDLFDLGALSERRRWTPDDQIDYDTTVGAIKGAVKREASVAILCSKENEETHTRKVIEAVYDNLSDYVATDVIDWGINDDALYFRDATNPNKTIYIPICAIKWYSIEDVPTAESAPATSDKPEAH